MPTFPSPELEFPPVEPEVLVGLGAYEDEALLDVETGVETGVETDVGRGLQRLEEVARLFAATA